jgi:hypothetical protein
VLLQILCGPQKEESQDVGKQRHPLGVTRA